MVMEEGETSSAVVPDLRAVSRLETEEEVKQLIRSIEFS